MQGQQHFFIYIRYNKNNKYNQQYTINHFYTPTKYIIYISMTIVQIDVRN